MRQIDSLFKVFKCHFPVIGIILLKERTGKTALDFLTGQFHQAEIRLGRDIHSDKQIQLT